MKYEPTTKKERIKSENKKKQREHLISQIYDWVSAKREKRTLAEQRETIQTFVRLQ